MGQLQQVNDRLVELGYQVIAISPDRPEKVSSVMEKNPYGYRLLSDTGLEAARALGVAFHVDSKTFEKLRGYGIDLEDASGKTHHLLPVPTVLVVDREGKIHWVYSNANYRVRPDPETVLAAAEKALD